MSGRADGSIGGLGFSFTGLLAFIFLGIVIILIGSLFHISKIYAIGEFLVYFGLVFFGFGRIRMPAMYKMAVLFILLVAGALVIL